MPWSTPTLTQARSIVRDLIRGQLPGADANVPNSVLRVLSDNQGALCHLVLQYIDWLAVQLMPDTAEQEWLDRFGYIWLVNADGSTGRKLATPASGSATFIGQPGGNVVPQATQLTYNQIAYATTADIIATDTPTAANVVALDPGSASNLDAGTELSLNLPIPGVLGTATVVTMDGGTDQETDDELRARILFRIRNPPMGGDADDYVAWALQYPGVTRAWCAPLEMGIGTVTVRFMMDDLRATNDPMTNGFPLPQDVADVQSYMNTVRPVAVKDFFVEAPIPYPIDCTIENLVTNDQATQNAITQSIGDMLYEKASPGQEIYFSWVDEAISNAPGEDHHDLDFTNTPMPAPGNMAVLGTITFLGLMTG